MRGYICRWTNGGFSFAFAPNREEADLLFDEVGNPDFAEVFPAPPRFAVHFGLHKRPDPCDCLPVSLECFNEECYLSLGSKLYPVLYALDEEADRASVQVAARQERTRLNQKKKVRLSRNIEERYLQEMGPDVPLALARSIVRGRRSKKLNKVEGERK